jgi:NADPH-dependent curcumin reductase CurA
MSESMNQQILLKSRPTGEPQESDFAFVEAEFLDDMGQWLQAGKLKYREDVV